MDLTDQEIQQIASSYDPESLLKDTGISDTSVSGGDPQQLTFAKNQIGSTNWLRDGQSYCEQFAGDMLSEPYPRTGKGSAYQAWQTQNGTEGTNGIKKGDLIYFSPNDSNGWDGHVGIYEGNGMMISANDKGVTEDNIDSWNTTNGTQVLGYVPQ